MPLFENLGIKSIGYWEPEHKGEFDLHYVVAFDSAEVRERIWPEFLAHPNWVAETGRWTDGPPYEMAKSTVMWPTDYSLAG